MDLKQLDAELSLELRKKKKHAWFRVNYKYMRRSASEQLEIIRLVENSDLGVKPFFNFAALFFYFLLVFNI